MIQNASPDWIVLGVANRAEDGHARYIVQCKRCGHIAIVSHCTVRETSKGTCKHYKHTGFTCKRLHITFNHMLDRCYNTKNKSFRFYGAKGVTICDEWLTNPKSFEDWALVNGYADNLTIDRIDSYKGYSPENCRWVSASDNAKWKKSTNSFTVNGITDSGRGWATRLSVGPNYINLYAQKHTKSET